jgi:8-oxo-dGTP pyrophosphatase MutT (NUDIX family)
MLRHARAGMSNSDFDWQHRAERFAPRVTVAAVVAHPEDQSLPAIERRYLFVEEWVGEEKVVNQPAGHLDPHEDLAAAAVREVLEETGWKVELTHLIAVYQFETADRAFVRFTFAAHAVERLHQNLDEGIVQILWLRLDELAARRLRSPMVEQGLQHFIAGHRHPLNTLQPLMRS